MSSSRKALFALSFAAKLLIGIIIISPILLGFFMSFMQPSEMANIPPSIFPKSFDIINYIKAMKSFPALVFLKNSLIVCLIVIVGQVITCSLAAFAFSFYEFRGKKLLFALVLSTMMIPVDSIIISNFLTIGQLGLKNTYIGLVAPYLTSAMGIFLMRQFYLTIPKELHEASMLDGCNSLRFLISIIFPISVPMMASLGVYVFIQTYNQFLWPLLVTDKEYIRTVQIGISLLRNSETVNYGIVLAGCVMVLIPSIIIFVFGQKFLVKGMTAGAVKG